MNKKAVLQTMLGNNELTCSVMLSVMSCGQPEMVVGFFSCYKGEKQISKTYTNIPQS